MNKLTFLIPKILLAMFLFITAEPLCFAANSNLDNNKALKNWKASGKKLRVRGFSGHCSKVKDPRFNAMQLGHSIGPLRGYGSSSLAIAVGGTAIDIYDMNTHRWYDHYGVRTDKVFINDFFILIITKNSGFRLFDSATPKLLLRNPSWKRYGVFDKGYLSNNLVLILGNKACVYDSKKTKGSKFVKLPEYVWKWKHGVVSSILAVAYTGKFLWVYDSKKGKWYKWGCNRKAKSCRIIKTDNGSETAVAVSKYGAIWEYKAGSGKWKLTKKGSRK